MNYTPVVTISQADVENKVLDYLFPLPTDDDYMTNLKRYLADLNSVNHNDMVMLVLYLEGYDLRTIGKYCGVSHMTVHNHVSRMLTHFRSL